jgi:peptide chain release factor subunit 1
MDNYKNLVSKMEIITDKTSEGNQFVKGFGGIGGILRYKVEANYEHDNDNDFNDEDFI